MIAPGGYMLVVSPERRETLLGYATPDQAVGEPVPAFALSRRAPLIVFGSFTPGHITHVADGRKGIASGTKMVRLNLTNIQELAVPISSERLLAEITPRARSAVHRRLRGGLLPPGAFSTVVEAVSLLAPDVASRLLRFSSRRGDLLARISEPARNALAQQKESVGLALKLADMDPRQLLSWSPPESGRISSFLDGLPNARVREDAMVVHDLDHFPGFDVIRSFPFAARTFEGDGTRLTVVLANKLPLEEQFGTDLIYFNESFRSFVMVQYKAMERGEGGKAEFRLPNRQLDIELERMERTLVELGEAPADDSRDGFRLHAGPFFMKLCSRHLFNPDDGGLFPGMYIPVDYWRRAAQHEATLGPKGGRVVTFENVGRRLTESEFVGLVAGAWVGTTSSQSSFLEALVRQILESGKAVAVARRTRQ